MHSNPNSLRGRIFKTSHRILLEACLRQIIPTINGKILVIGAGHNPYGKLSPPGATLVITDITDESPGIDVVADAHALPFEDRSFDAIIAIEVFEHLHTPTTAAREAYRVLKEGGTALISLPFMFCVHADPFDFNRPTYRSLELMFADFSRVKVAGYGNQLHVISDIITMAARPLVLLRLLNHLFARGPLANLTSRICPSGYIVQATK